MRAKVKVTVFDKDYLRRCKQSSAESKLNWLAAALEFARTKKKIIKKFTQFQSVSTQIREKLR